MLSYTCSGSALDSVKSDYATLARAGKGTRIATVVDLGTFATSKGQFIAITLEAPQRLHRLVPVENVRGSCSASAAIMDFYDDERGGGGVSVHN